MNLKKELIIGAIGSVLAVLLTFFYINQYQKQKEQFKKISQNETAVQASKTSDISLTIEEIAKHNAANDCWIIIQGSVYNVTNYLILHPGGSDRIVPFCGQDATDAFAAKGGKGTHSAQAALDLSKLKLGQLNEAVNITDTNNQIQNNVNLINISGRAEEREREDDD